MAVRKLSIRCYRTTPGDADCPNIPAFGEDGFEDDMVEQAGFLLLAYFNDPDRVADRKPQLAHLEDEQGQILARIRVAGPDKIERITN